VTFTFDASQAAVLHAVQEGSVVATGGPGTGKTTIAVEAVVRAVANGVAPERVMVLAPTRLAAASLRDRVSLAVSRPTGVALVRTPSALAFSILKTAAAERDEASPSLITGAEQDVVIKELLEGHRTGLSNGPDWSGIVVPESLQLPGFRNELRNLMMRAAEADLTPEDLASLARKSGRQEWLAGAAFYREYLDVLQLRTGPSDAGARYDPAVIVARAADQLHEGAHEGQQAPWDLVVVDDYQDVTAATGALIGVLTDAGVRVLLFGNADQTAEGFRGALPHGLERAASVLGIPHLELAIGYRQQGSLARVTARVAARISVAGVGSARASGRADAAAEPVSDGSVEVLTAPHAYAQSRAIAARLRRARHEHATPWSQMVVMARSRAQLRDIRSDLLAADIPCESLGDGVALHREPAVEPLLTILRIALGDTWTHESAVAVLCSRVVGLDSLGLRRLRRDLLREEREGGGERGSAELLLEALATANGFSSLRSAEAKLASRAAAAVAAATERAGKQAATPGAVIWAAWAALGVADHWRTAALAGSTRDDADLDAIVSLLRAAQTYAERLPAATALAFLDYLEAQDFAADVLGARAQGGDTVTFATPASAVGREWEVVVVAGLDEGVWPNLRLRDSVLGSQRLAEALAEGPAGAVERASGDRDLRQARREVLDDETRSLLVAVSRARRHLIVTAISDGERLPSRFVPVIESAAGVTAQDAAGQPLVADLRAVVARLRSDAARSLAARETGEGVGQAAIALARLAALGEATADPANWYGVADPTADTGMWDDDAIVRVSPSRYDAVRRCPLRWALETVGGTRESSEAQNTGLLVHALAEQFPTGTLDELLVAFDEAWGKPPTTLPERAQYDKTRDMVVRLAGYIGTRADVAVLTEQRFRVQVDNAEISGSADRLELGAEGVSVVDLKTGAPIRQADGADHGQLKLYQLAANHGGFEGIQQVDGAALVFLGGTAAQTGTLVTQPPIDDPAVRAELRDVVTTMTSAGFPACINDTCSSCPVIRSCPAHAQGAQVGA